MSIAVVAMTTPQHIKTEGINANITPFAFQHYAKDFLGAFKAHKSAVKFSPARLFLICRSIELAAKSLHLVAGKSLKQLKTMSHDLEKACDTTVLCQNNINLTAQEIDELRKANAYYAGKGFEYFIFKHANVALESSGPELAARGWPSLPDEVVLEQIANRLVSVKV